MCSRACSVVPILVKEKSLFPAVIKIFLQVVGLLNFRYFLSTKKCPFGRPARRSCRRKAHKIRSNLGANF